MRILRSLHTSLILSRRAVQLVWESSPRVVLALLFLTLLAGVAPALATYVSKLVVDGVVAAIQGDANVQARVLFLVGIEALLIMLVAGALRGLTTADALMHSLLTYTINIKILTKTISLDLTQFEEPEINDRLERARREASSRPLSLLQRILLISRSGILLAGYGYLLLDFSPLALVVLFFSGMPAFAAEIWFSNLTYKHRQGREEAMRRINQFQMVLTQDRFAQELRLFRMGPKFLEQFSQLFQKTFRSDRALIQQRGVWGVALHMIGSAVFYAAYAWIVYATMNGGPTLGEMTMYLVIFRQGQNAITASLQALSGLYEDRLYIANLFLFLDTPVPPPTGHALVGAKPGDGIRFVNVSYSYPDRKTPALRNITLHIRQGEKFALIGENGSGKSTLMRLLMRLLQPDRGRILLDGTDVRDWDLQTLYRRIGVIFQIFNQYKITVGENIGAGDVDAFHERDLWERAARFSSADVFIENLPGGYDTQLGRSFPGGQELSGGQWQRIALARAFMRSRADILILDEPTSAVDAEVEARVFAKLRDARQTVVIITHRFATIRKADHIVLLKNGRILEEGTHNSLYKKNGEYRRLFQLQAHGQ